MLLSTSRNDYGNKHIARHVRGHVGNDSDNVCRNCNGTMKKRADKLQETLPKVTAF